MNRDYFLIGDDRPEIADLTANARPTLSPYQPEFGRGLADLVDLQLDIDECNRLWLKHLRQTLPERPKA